MTLLLPFERPVITSFGDLLDSLDSPEPDDGLRWYQREALSAISRDFEEHRSTLIVMATGTGKTRCFSQFAKEWDQGPILFLAHREELIQQAAAELTIRLGESVDIERAGEQASFRARYIVGSVQSVCQKRRLERMGTDRFSLIVTDECFPAGTPVSTPLGSQPIESITLGQDVLAMDHGTGMVRPSRVVRLFKNRSPSMWRLRYGASDVRCTANHPFFVRGAGYVPACEVKRGDLLYVRRAGSTEQEDVLSRVLPGECVGPYGAHEPQVRRGADAREQPDASRRQSGAHEEDAQEDRPQASCPRRQRHGRHGGREDDCGGSGLGDTGRGHHPQEARLGLSPALQARRGESRVDDCDRGGRREPRFASAPSPGPEEGGLSAWVRVDSSSCDEPTSPGGDLVYNIEVEGCHTYFAHETLVHNCHHATSSSYRRIYDWFGKAKHLGVTATPDRSDEKALGKIFDAVSYVFDIEQGINEGFLVPIRGKHVDVKEADVSKLKTHAGDLSEGELDEVMVQAAAGICQETLRLEPDRKGIAFWPGVRSSQLACETFNKLRPGSACHIDGAMNRDERAEIVRAFKRGQYQYLMNCSVATEGFDCPDVNLIISGRPTKSRARYAQEVGRGTRVLTGLIDALRGKDESAQRKALVAASAKPDLMVLDFVANAGKHDLVTPEDLLGGSYSEEEVALAKKKRGGGGNVRDELEKARAELQRMAKAAQQARVASQVTDFDPFRALGLDVSESNRYARFGKPVPDRLREALERKGVDAGEVARLNLKSAGMLYSEMKRRHSEGLCTYKQAKWLQRYGVDGKDVSFANATAALDYIFACRKRADQVDGARLDGIITRQREPGDDG